MLRIKLRTSADPPGARQHGDEAIVRMEMRPAEMIAGLPFIDHDVEAWLGRITDQDRTRVAAARAVLPRDLFGQLERDGRGIELDRGGRRDQADDNGCSENASGH